MPLRGRLGPGPHVVPRRLVFRREELRLPPRPSPGALLLVAVWKRHRKGAPRRGSRACRSYRPGTGSARGGGAAPSARARVYGAQRRDQQLGSGNAARLHVSGLRQCDSGNPAAAESHSKFTPAFTALWLFTLETASSRGGAGRTGGGAESTAATVLRSPAPRGRQDPVPRSVPACVLLTHQTTSAGVARRCRGRRAARPSRQPREVTSGASRGLRTASRASRRTR